MAVSTEYKCKVVTDKKGNVNVLISYVQKNDSVVLEDWTQKLLKYKYVWLSLILAVVVTTVLCIMLIPQSHAKNNSEDVPLPRNYSMRLRTRPEWFSTKSEVNCDPLSIHPPKFVIVSHTVTTNCYKQINCENVVKEIQGYHLKIHYCDIAYNFVIGGDGYIYEGRGWGKSGAHTKGFNCDSIGVAFLGNYNLQYLSPKMEEAFHLLMEEGVKIGEIADDYKLFGHTQVRGSDSPGVHVMEKIKEWKHWSEFMKEDILCYMWKRANLCKTLVVSDIQLPYNYSMRLRTRPEWFSMKTEVNCKPLSIHPAKFVIVAHTVTTNCYKEINCENVLKSIQTYDIKNQLCDISYNFVIGGDGYIYEGRGWGKSGGHTFVFNCDSIGVAFLGNYNLQYLSPKMEEAFKLLVEEGLKLGEIAEDYKLFGQSQVRDSDSPGVHVMEVIKKWKGWAKPKKEDLLCIESN
nr:peptidoglycan recognition protein 3 [Halyomorpha halys]